MTSGHDNPTAADDCSVNGIEGGPVRAPLDETCDSVSDTASRLGAPDAKAAAAAREAWIGKRVGRYEITRLLGYGGMGVVYQAHDTLIERDVAIKILPEEISRDEVSLKRLMAEARAAGKLSHGNAVAIYEVGQEDGIYYLVMELVAGGSVGDQLEQSGPIDPLEATRIAADACRGLAAAHAVGMVHRDIKPVNLLRAADGAVKVADFGLAKPTLGGSGELTQTGHIVGTPYFMSPEQCESRPIDHRSDIYSLGATYYCLLTGVYPYDNSGSIVQVMYSHVNGEVLDPRSVDTSLPASCSQIVARATAKRPDDRYQNAGEMLGDLESLAAALAAGVPASKVVLSRAPRRVTRYQLAGLAAAILLIAAALFFFLGRESASPGHPSADNTPAVAPPTGPPIRVGVLHSLSGTMAKSESVVVDATLLAIEEINQAGGLLGRPVEAIVADGRSDDEVFGREAKKLLAEDRVCTVFGCWTSSSRKTVVPIIERRNHLLLYPVQYEGLEQSPNVVYLGATPNQQIVPAIRWAYAFGGKRKFFVVGSDYIFPRAASAIIHDTIDELGAQLVGEEYLPMGSYDVKAVVEKIVAARPDVILNTINGDTNLAFFKELRGRGVTPERTSTISFSVGEEELRFLNISQLVGDYAAWTYFESLDSPLNRDFVARFRARYGPKRVVTDPMEAAYGGVKLWAQAVKRAGSDDVNKIRKALAGQRLLAPEGEVRIDPATRHLFQTPRVGRVSADGELEVVWDAAQPEPPLPFPPSRSRADWQAFLDQWYSRWGNRWSAPSE